MHGEVTFILDSRLVLVWQRQMQQTHGLQEKAVVEGGRLVFLNFIQGSKICRVWRMTRRLVTGEMDRDCCSVILLEISAISINKFEVWRKWGYGGEKYIHVTLIQLITILCLLMLNLITIIWRKWIHNEVVYPVDWWMRNMIQIRGFILNPTAAGERVCAKLWWKLSVLRQLHILFFFFHVKCGLVQVFMN